MKCSASVMNMTRSKAIRSTTKRLDTAHSAAYFAQETVEELNAIGVSADNQYLAQRAAPLGAASAELVTATFYSFAPGFVSQRVPACWKEASPEKVHAARLRAVDRLFERITGSEGGEQLISSIAGIRSALAPVLDAQDMCGKPLYAAHLHERRRSGAASDLVELWWDITLLREFRGDVHLAALIASGVGALEAVVLDSATGKTFKPRYMRAMRGWTEEEWAEVAESLASRGLVTGSDDDAQLTEEGLKLRGHVESLTDHGVARAWEALSEDDINQLQRLASMWAVAVGKAGIIPQDMFGTGK